MKLLTFLSRKFPTTTAESKSMNAYEKKFLVEIQLSIHEIEAVLGTGFRFMEMDGNVPLIQAVAEELKIIAEAVEELSRNHPVFSISAHRIIEIGKGVETDDGRITLEDIKSVLKNDLPLLKEEVQQFLMQE